MERLFEAFDARLDLIPEVPGVYLMKDAEGTVIYVGKAINLPRRLHSYFQPNPQGSAKVLAMISHIEDFSYVVCSNELEALVLENNFIKQYKPRYNILLRDDKEYPYLKLTMNEPYPRLLKSFHVGEDQKEGVRYFGPYLSGDLWRALDAIYRIFPLKRCRRVLPRDIGRERPCLNYHIGKCIGPCLGTVSQEDYRAVCEEIIDFLEGRSDDLSKRFESKMKEAAADLKFEQAARYRDRLEALRKLHERQIIVSPEKNDQADVLGLARNGSEIAVQLLKVREGRLISAAAFFFPDQEEAESEILSAFITQYYGRGHEVPRELILPLMPEDQAPLESFLEKAGGRKSRLHQAQRGHKAQWLKMAARNAHESLQRHTLMGGGNAQIEKALASLGEFLGLAEAPQRIEAYDIANTGESDRAASMVVFEKGKPRRTAYRHFKIKSFEGQNDFASMHEVLSRRLEHLDDQSFAGRPDLILLDGGKGQLSAVASLLREKAPDIGLGGMVKDERHRTHALLSADHRLLVLRHSQQEEAKMSPEERERDLALLRLLTAIQNEAHRFAGQLNKKMAKKRNLRWSLEEIPGVGPRRRALLMKEFKSLKAISEADPEALKAVAGLPVKTAEAVYRHFHPEVGR